MDFEPETEQAPPTIDSPDLVLADGRTIFSFPEGTMYLDGDLRWSHDSWSYASPLCYTVDGLTTGLGTCFPIAELRSGAAVYLTATHVLPDNVLSERRGSLFIFRPLFDPERLIYASVVNIQYSDDTDIAVLTVDVRNCRTVPPMKGLVLDLTRPLLGDDCLIFGFTKIDFTQASLNPDALIPLEEAIGVAATSGVITDILPAGRSSSYLPFPIFCFDGPLGSGMSGGPVFNGRTGGVVGVAMSSSGPESLEKPYSHASFISTIGLGSFNVGLDGADEQMTLGGLIKAGIPTVDQLGSYTLTRLDGRLTLSWDDHF